MTLSKVYLSTEKRQTISKTFSWLPSPAPSPTTKKLGFFSKFRSSVTSLDQILSSDEEEEQTPTTPRDSLHLISPKLGETPPPPPPQHISLNQYVQEILACTFEQVDERIEKEWDQERQRLEVDLLAPAPFQFS